MKIIAHRGYWKDASEKNTFVAFERAFENGFGVETDFRDYKGTLVISHDIPKGNEVTADEFFELYSKYSDNHWLALNIKADGLQPLLKDLIEKNDVKNYFCFDMSIPDTLGYLSHGLNIFSRTSEYEKETPFYEKSNGVWMDCFHSDFNTNDDIKNHVKNGKKVCIVSSELHKREHLKTWQKYRNLNPENIMICTDYPQEAKEFFNDKD